MNDDPPIGCALLFGLLLFVGFLFVLVLLGAYVALDPLSR